MEQNLTPIIKDSFLQFAGAVLQSRALPDARDCMKPSARQIFYCLYTDKFIHSKPYQKTLKAIGSAFRMYIHGDSSAEGVIMRAAQPFAMRYPLIEVEGSYGTLLAAGSWAAPRYTSSRLTKLSEYLFLDIQKDTIDEWRDNYDNTEQYPMVLPSKGFFNLVNGSYGIGVGASSSIPQYNLKELNEALIKLLWNPDIDFDEIYCAPDFATGAILLNASEVKESHKNGHGFACKLRSKVDYDQKEKCFVVTEIPYMVYTETICKELEEIINGDKNPGIDRFNDLTGEKPLIKIYLKKGTNPKKAIDYLYKNTSLESYYSINFTMLKDGRWPTTFGWKQCLQEYITHIRQCKTREIQFDLDKALARKNIVDGLIKAYSIIDEVVALIRSSANSSEASSKLISTYQFNEEQAKAILAMKLSSLTKLDIVKLNEEREELEEKIEWYNYLLNDTTALDNELIKILEEVATKFGDERRTKILNLVEPEEEQETVQEEDVGLMLFDNNIIRVIKKEDLQGAKRGKKGVNIKPPKGANLINTLYTSNLGTVAAFTNYGRMYNFSLSELDFGKDYSIYELIVPQDNEKVILLIDTTSFNAYHYLITVSKNGYIKKSTVNEYNSRAKKGVVAVKLEEGDKLVGVYLSMSDNDKIFVAGENGYYNYYSISEISSTGRATKGVKAIKLSTNEKIAGATIIKDNIEYRGILSITSSGKGKITTLNDFNETTRAIKGNQVMVLKEEKLSTVYAVPASQEKLFVSANNKAVLLDTTSIPIQNRATAGVRIIDARGTETSIEIM